MDDAAGGAAAVLDASAGRARAAHAAAAAGAAAPRGAEGHGASGVRARHAGVRSRARLLVDGPRPSQRVEDPRATAWEMLVNVSTRGSADSGQSATALRTR